MIEELQNYLCDTGIHNKDNDMVHYEKQGLIGDQLTVERCVNAKASMSNGYDAKIIHFLEYMPPHFLKVQN